ncbi:MAG: response regulator [Chlorogloeopsis fritschii C42_A2020_084]|uniref:response regulator transcription factor n=1 Tax=Chlorogloeopsis fritschii TaxID=1124 RepID=UPI001A010947|nr:response regulator [Chlorogloeopsis fritschii]MBF2005685.1 response regulator [Chlorogloeopsis fritschii C42_A2020_084]
MTKILIAEDEPRIASFLEKGLQANGYSTAIAKDGCEAVLLTQQDNFDLLILDLHLPGKDGLTVVQELRERGEQLPIIILSACSDLSNKITGLQSRFNDYLTKPFRFEELLMRIKTQLQ